MTVCPACWGMPRESQATRMLWEQLSPTLPAFSLPLTFLPLWPKAKEEPVRARKPTAHFTSSPGSPAAQSPQLQAQVLHPRWKAAAPGEQGGGQPPGHSAWAAGAVPGPRRWLPPPPRHVGMSGATAVHSPGMFSVPRLSRGPRGPDLSQKSPFRLPARDYWAKNPHRVSFDCNSP